MDTTLISDGLTLSLFGMLTTFLALGLFILSMMLLRWAFPTEKRQRPKIARPAPIEAHSRGNAATPLSPDDEDEADEALAAVIAAGMLLRQGANQNTLGDEAAAAAAAAWWLKENRAFLPAGVIPARQTARMGLGARLEDRRGRWWQPQGDH